jgi:F0F1-type ATP synthase assembly protein I
MKENAPYLTLGMQMALTIALGAGIGWWVDKQSGNSMWLGIGAGIGAVLGMGYFILVVLRIDSKTKPKKHK